jgi:hypothetical protein
MAIPVAIAMGEHILYADSVDGWKAAYADANPPAVELTASIRVGQNPPIYPKPYGGTTVAFQMDARVAIGLYEQLGDLIRSMGWQQHISSGRPI